MTTFDGFEPKLVELVQERIEASKKLRIVAIALGEMGHLLPVVRLVAALEASGHEVAAILTNGGARERATAILTQMKVKAELICPDEFTSLSLYKGIGQEDKAVSQSFENLLDERIVQKHFEKVLELEPDILVADFFSGFALKVADRAQLPVVVNCPMTLPMMQMEIFPGISEPARTAACCGCLCLYPSVASTALAMADYCTSKPSFHSL